MKYNLRIRCEIQQTDDFGGYMGGNLAVEENVTLGQLSFLEITSVLAEFHKLAEKLQGRTDE